MLRAYSLIHFEKAELLLSAQCHLIYGAIQNSGSVIFVQLIFWTQEMLNRIRYYIQISVIINENKNENIPDGETAGSHEVS